MIFRPLSELNRKIATIITNNVSRFDDDDDRFLFLGVVGDPMGVVVSATASGEVDVLDGVEG